MSDILVRDLDAKTLVRLKARARRNGRSLQSEAKLLLEQASGISFAEMRNASQTWRRKLKGRKFEDSARLIRADRGR